MHRFNSCTRVFGGPELPAVDEHGVPYTAVHTLSLMAKDANSKELSRGMSTSTRSSASGNALPRKTRTTKYRTVGRSSVDESLFTGGGVKRNTERTRNMDAEKRELQNLQFKKSGKTAPKPTEETMKIITKDLIRDLRIPQKDPSGKSVILPQSEFERIRQRSLAPLLEDKKQAYAKQKQREAKVQDSSTFRRKEMQAHEVKRKAMAKPTDLAEEARQRAKRLQQEVTSATVEREDEIKCLNTILLEAKCNAVRDLQVDEKEMLGSLYTEEEKRLDGMMEAERRRQVEEFERQENRRKLDRLEGSKVLRTQIEKRDQQRLLDEEKKDQETQQMLRYLQRLQEEDVQERKQKKEKQDKLMVEVNKSNDEIKQQRLARRDQEKQEDLQVARYLQQKAEREEALAKEAEAQRIAKEKETARLRALQERAKDEQAEKDALAAKRDQEAAERTWRRREKERIIREAKMNEDLIRSRVDQVRHKEHYLAVQAARDRDIFTSMVHEQTKALEEEKQVETRKRQSCFVNSKVVRTQISDKEKEKVSKRSDFFEEGRRIDREAQERRERLHAIKMKKLEELQKIGIPDKYCAQVSRHIHAPPPSFTMGKPT